MLNVDVSIQVKEEAILFSEYSYDWERIMPVTLIYYKIDTPSAKADGFLGLVRNRANISTSYNGLPDR